MKYRVIVRPEAEHDLKEAFSWYEDNRTGLGYDFLIKRFPYKIIYLAEGEKIVILAVIHGKRSPDLIKKRIESI